MITVIVVLLLLYAVAAFFGRDFLWELTELQDGLQGRASERSELWDSGTLISGVIAVTVALVLMGSLR